MCNGANCKITDCPCKRPSKPKPHKWANEIKAWADGATIQFNINPSKYDWEDVIEKCPIWDNTTFYRVKPAPKPDLIVNAMMSFKYAWKSPDVFTSWNGDVTPAGQRHVHNIEGLTQVRFTFVEDTNKIKSVEIIK